jgi:hypothetical protein
MASADAFRTDMNDGRTVDARTILRRRCDRASGRNGMTGQRRSLGL